MVRFWIRGKPWLVNVDDRVPFLPGTDTPAHARISQYNSFWPLIAEKAWAKINGGYIEGGNGFASNAMRALTGVPVFDYMTKDLPHEDIWDLFIEAQQNNYPIIANTGPDKDAVKLLKLRTSHAYSILAVFSVNAEGFEKQVN